MVYYKLHGGGDGQKEEKGNQSLSLHFFGIGNDKKS
jgi:hypothetical protein